MDSVPASRSGPPWLPFAALLVSMLSIQLGASLAKRLFPVVGASGASVLRIGIATVLLMLALRPWRIQAARVRWPALTVYGVSLGLMNLLFYLSLQTLPLGIAVALEFLGPLALALAGSRRPSDVLWVALAVAGLALLLPAAGGHALDPKGAAYALAAGACWALYILSGQKAGAGHGPAVVAWGSMIATAVLAPIGIAEAGAALLAPALLPVALGVALLSTALPYSLEMVALTRLPARTFGMLMSLEPVFGALSGVLFLHERLSPAQWLGLCGIVVASAGTAMTARAPAPG